MSNDNAFTKGLFEAYDKLQKLEDRLITTMSVSYTHLTLPTNREV